MTTSGRPTYTSNKQVIRLFAVILLTFTCLLFSPSAFAQTDPSSCVCTSPSGCMLVDCELAEEEVRRDHEKGEKDIIEFIQKEFNRYRDWLTDWDTSPSCVQNINTKCRKVRPSFFRAYFLPEAMEMTEQMSAVAHQQALTVGAILDSDIQLETQRKFQELEFEAYRDYQPSRDFCAFGTNVRSIAHSEQRGKLSSVGLAARQLARHLGSASTVTTGVAGAAKSDDDREARWEQFRDHYCDPRDNNYTGQATGLVLACGAGGDRTNRDIDFTRVIEHERTLDVNFTDGSGTGNPTNDEEDILALSSNLYGHNMLTRRVDEDYLSKPGSKELYVLLRSAAAKRSVAENSYNAIVGLKSSGTANVGNTRDYLGAVIKELGVTNNDDIYRIIGTNPSYYAQLEILARKLYQNTDFYTNLYSTPANIERKSVALKAIELMLDRAIYESELRQEMATSVLLTSRLQKQAYPGIRTDILNLADGG